MTARTLPWPQTGRGAPLCAGGDFRDSPMKWFWPRASISSRRTRPPGACRRVTLRPSMREHC